jgi:hypothetical protein
VLRRLRRAIARLNARLSSAAVASSVEESGLGGSPTASAVGVKTVLGEIESDAAREQEPEDGADVRDEP